MATSTQSSFTGEGDLSDGWCRLAGPWACLWGIILIMLTESGNLPTVGSTTPYSGDSKLSKSRESEPSVDMDTFIALF